MVSSRSNQDLMREMTKKLATEQLTPIEKLRCVCLSRGVKGIVSIGRTFRIFDDSRDRKLDKQEFFNGVRDYTKTDSQITESEIDTIFVEMDKDNTGTISFEEFLRDLRPPMSKRRTDLIMQAFDKMDKTGDGVITEDDLKGVYDIKHNPKYMSGEWTASQCYNAFLKEFEVDTNNRADNKVTREEFVNYYAGVSASVDTDSYFDLMMRQAWKL